MDNSVKIYFDGPDAPVAPGSQISVSVLVDASTPVNAFDLAVVFSVDKLKFLGSDNTGSIVDIWQTKPSSEAAGRIEFSGGILDPFTGSKGMVVKFSFQVLGADSPEAAHVAFTKSDFFLSDGQGTKVSALASEFSLSVKENTQVVSAPFVPFQSTPTDVLIEGELDSLRAEDARANSLTLFLILALVIFVICCVTVYNKTKRKL